MSNIASNMDYGDFLTDLTYREKMPNAIYKAALYLRLSRDDANNDKESMSILSQRKMLMAYAKDISKKIRSSRKIAAKDGKFMGSQPPYGYIRSAEDKHKLVVDREAAKVVKRIFELFKNHESARHIADILNSEGVLTPQVYYYQSLGKENPYTKNAKSWCSSTILSILKKEVYLSHTVQCKKAVKSYKTKEVVNLPPEKWVTVENTHEPIIEIEAYNAVQQMLLNNRNKKQRKTSINREISLFSNYSMVTVLAALIEFLSNF